MHKYINHKRANRKCITRKCLLHLCLYMLVLSFAAGCEDGRNSQTEEIASLQLQTAHLKGYIEQSKAKNEQLKKQVQVLSGLPAEVRMENLYNLQKIKITRYTNLYDKNKDGKKEKLIVYIQPIDQQGDIVKASGAVDVQLWDLHKENGKAMLAEWRVEPDELKELWFATLLTTNYRLTFDVSDKIKDPKVPLTVKVTFTDYLSGKVLEEQRAIKPCALH